MSTASNKEVRESLQKSMRENAPVWRQLAEVSDGNSPIEIDFVDPEPPVPPAQPHTCPVCQGRRYLPSTFYYPSYGSTTAINSVPCQTCLGTGVLWR